MNEEEDEETTEKVCDVCGRADESVEMRLVCVPYQEGLKAGYFCYLCVRDMES